MPVNSGAPKLLTEGREFKTLLAVKDEICCSVESNSVRPGSNGSFEVLAVHNMNSPALEELLRIQPPQHWGINE